MNPRMRVRYGVMIFAASLFACGGVPGGDQASDAGDDRRTDDRKPDAGGPPPERGDGDRDAGDSAGDQPAALTVVTLNTHSFQEGADSLDKLEWIGEGLAAMGADLVGLNEVMSGTFWSYDYDGAQYDGTRIIQDALERASGHPWYSASFGFAHWDDGEEMANVVLSRAPIREADRRELTTTDFWPAPQSRRNVAFARTEISGVGVVHFFATHTWGWNSADAAVQIDEVKAFIDEKSTGDEDLTLLVGDFNTPSTWDHYERWIEGEPFRLIDTYAEANPDGFTDSTMFGEEHRIDYIMARDGSPLLTSPVSYTSSLVFTGEPFDGVVLPKVSDHKGVVTVFELP